MTTRPTALVLCAADPNKNPRPNRMIHWLKSEYTVTVVGWSPIHLDGVESISLFGQEGAELERVATGKHRGIYRYAQFFLYCLRLFTGRFEEIVWSRLGRAKKVAHELAGRNFDLIVSHDCTLLPLAFEVKRPNNKVVFDAREYYPRNYDDQWRWRLFTKPVNVYLCKTYLTRCDKVLTVSDGLAQEYEREFGVKPEVIMSLPDYQPLSPVSTDGDKIKMIYHGAVGASRKTEVMIEMMDLLDERFTLDLMLMPASDEYYQKIVSLADSRGNVRIIPPVPMNQIPAHINQYDIGLFLCPPSNFNLKFALPNKLFEYIQARLAVAIGPNVDMRRIVEQYKCGIVSLDFLPHSMTDELRSLTPKRIMQYKQNSHKAAWELSAETNRNNVLNLFQKLRRVSHVTILPNEGMKKNK